ncbi:MAG: hypothetical protein ACD_46C00552G0001 [uncultured bacterium]|nr:MAG: hypothetical protein ACD_46C00552G0001 [uncultured bacterium]
MLMKDFISQLKDSLKNIEELNAQSSHEELAMYLHLEAAFTVRELKKLLKNFEKDNREANHETLKPFMDFLATRWNRIKNTDAIYNINPHSYANRLCKCLSDKLEIKTNINALKLLMPTLKEFNDLSLLRLNEWVLTDDNDYGIIVADSINNLEDNQEEKGKLKMTCQVNGFKRKLSNTEQERITKHSEVAENYYKLKSDPNSTSTIISRAKKGLRIALDQQPEYIVRATYGESGLQLLKKSVLNNIDKCFKDRQQFLTFLRKQFDKNKWISFIDSCDKDAFEQLFLEGKYNDKFAQVANDPKMMEGDVEYKRAVRTCLLEIYKRDREPRPEYETYTGMAVAQTGLFVFPKTKKLNVVDRYQAHVLTAKKPEEFNTFLENNPDLMGLTLGYPTGPLFSGDLGLIAKPHKKEADEVTATQKLETAAKLN